MVDVLGSRLGRYDLRERIGRGGMATVYKAWDTNLDRWVAVKVLLDHLAGEADFKQRFEREAKLIAALSHPNIVQIYDFDQTTRKDESIYYMVMAFIAGPTLRGVMERQHAKGDRLSLTEISRVMDSVCSALAYAHQQGITHRDVTPGNILFSDQGAIVLADFGLARLASGTRLTQSGMTTGTPMYMSPEQCLGLPSDARSDLYSLGVILFEMLSGEAPYGGDSAYAIIMKHVNEPVPPLRDAELHLPPSASASLSAVVARALAKSPDDRYQAAAEFLVDFQQAIRGELPAGTITAKLPTSHPLTGAATTTATLPTGSISNAPRRLTPIRQLRPVLWAVGTLIVIGVAVAALLARTAILQSGAMTPSAVAPTPSPSVSTSMTDTSPSIDDDYTQGPSGDNPHWQLTGDDPHITRQYMPASLQIRSVRPMTATATIIDRQYADYADPYVVEATLALSTDSQPESAAGIIFRYVNDQEYYVFAVDGIGRVSIWERKNGEWIELRHPSGGVQWTAASAVNKAGTANDLLIVVDGDHLQGYANDSLIIDVRWPNAVADGGVGIYLATVNNVAVANPLAQVDVANFSVAPHATSMTGPGPASVSTPTPIWF